MKVHFATLVHNSVGIASGNSKGKTHQDMVVPIKEETHSLDYAGYAAN